MVGSRPPLCSRLGLHEPEREERLQNQAASICPEIEGTGRILGKLGPAPSESEFSGIRDVFPGERFTGRLPAIAIFNLQGKNA